MKVTYEFEPIEDADELRMVEIRHDMYGSLCDLEDLRRSIYKGWSGLEDLDKEAFTDKLLDSLSEIIVNSKIDEIS